MEEVELLNCNPQYACVRFPDGKEENVSLRKLAPKVPTTEPCVSEAPPEVIHSVDAESTDQDPETSTDTYTQLVDQQQRIRPYNLRGGDV